MRVLEFPMFLMVSLAFAFPADAAPAECAAATLSESIPAANATDVPVDLHPLFVFSGTCGVGDPYTLTLTRAGDTVPVVEEVYDFNSFDNHGDSWLLEPDFGTLDTNTAYTVVLASEWGESTQFGFTTGEATVQPIIGGVPDLSIDFASQDKISNGYFTTMVEVRLTSAGIGEGAYILREAGVDRGVIVATGPSDFVSLAWPTYEPASEICLSAVERDGAGGWHGPSNEVCAGLEGSAGCSTTPSPWLAGWMVLPLLALRRRRA